MSEIIASKSFERPHVQAGIYDAEIVGFRTVSDKGEPIKTQYGPIGVLEFKMIDGTMMGRPVSLKINEKSTLGKIYLALGVEIKAGETYYPLKDLVTRKCRVVVTDFPQTDKMSGKTVIVSRISEVMAAEESKAARKK
mgnify:CR=1 FL=1